MLPDKRLRHDEEERRQLSEEMSEVNAMASGNSGTDRRPFVVVVTVVAVVAVVTRAPLFAVKPVPAEVKEGSERGFVLEHDLRW